MVASIGVIASPSQGVSYYERDGYYARGDPAHREASAWAGKGAEGLGLSGQVDPDVFEAVLEGKVPDGPHLGNRGRDGEIHHRPGRDVTLSAPKSVSLMSLVGGDVQGLLRVISGIAILDVADGEIQHATAHGFIDKSG